MSEKQDKPENKIGKERYPLWVRRTLGTLAAAATIFYGAGEAHDALKQPMKAKGVQTVEADSLSDAIYEHVGGVEDLDPRKVQRYVKERLGEQGQNSKRITVPIRVEDLNSLRIGDQFQSDEQWEGLETDNPATVDSEIK